MRAAVCLCVAAALSVASAVRVLQFVPGFSNSHLLFNYRLAEALGRLGHNVSLWTQMELSMVLADVSAPPADVDERRVPIRFGDALQHDGLQVFQRMMFNEHSAYDLWWTGKQFEQMRLDACRQMLALDTADLRDRHFDVAIAHFHDLCPLALANELGIKKVVWVTHGPSVYDYNAKAMGFRPSPSYVPHALSAASDTMGFFERLVNVLWHLSGIDFVNLPVSLLHNEARLYREFNSSADLLALSRQVDLLLLNGERWLDFARPLPDSVGYLGQLHAADAPPLDDEWRRLADDSGRGLVLFALGTVSNTSQMPVHMRDSFLGAFAAFPDYTFVCRFEGDAAQLRLPANVRVVRWMPQRQLLRHPKTKLLISHGGYNSLVESATAGVPGVFMPLFADQFINGARAVRRRIGVTLDKGRLDVERVRQAVAAVLDDPSYAENARKLAAILHDKPVAPDVLVDHLLRSVAAQRPTRPLPARHLSFVQYHCLDVIGALAALLLFGLWAAAVAARRLWRVIMAAKALQKAQLDKETRADSHRSNGTVPITTTPKNHKNGRTFIAHGN